MLPVPTLFLINLMWTERLEVGFHLLDIHFLPWVLNYYPQHTNRALPSLLILLRTHKN